LKLTTVGIIDDQLTDAAIIKLIQVYKINCNIYHNKTVISKSKARTQCYYTTLYKSDKWKETERKPLIPRIMSTKYSNQKIINEMTSIAIRNHQFWIFIHVNRLMN
jgi:hypothetical protein